MPLMAPCDHRAVAYAPMGTAHPYLTTITPRNDNVRSDNKVNKLT